MTNEISGRVMINSLRPNDAYMRHGVYGHYTADSQRERTAVQAFDTCIGYGRHDCYSSVTHRYSTLTAFEALGQCSFTKPSYTPSTT